MYFGSITKCKGISPCSIKPFFQGAFDSSSAFAWTAKGAVLIRRHGQIRIRINIQKKCIQMWNYLQYKSWRYIQRKSLNIKVQKSKIILRFNSTLRKTFIWFLTCSWQKNMTSLAWMIIEFVSTLSHVA